MSNLLSPFNLSKGDRYRIMFSLPSAIQQRVTDIYATSPEKVVFDSFLFNIYEVKLPDVEIPAVTVDFSGDELNVSSHARAKYGLLEFNYDIDSLLLNYTALYNWLDALHDDSDGLFDSKNRLRNGSDLSTIGKEEQFYMGTLYVQILNEWEKPVAEWCYYNAFPTKVSGPTIDYRISGKESLSSVASFAFSQVRFRPIFGA